MRAPLHPDEAQRIAALRETGLLDQPPDPLQAAIVKLAAEICGTPIAAISLVDTDRQWFPAITGLDCKQTNRDVAFCAYTILDDAPLIVPDATLDARFSDNTLVTAAPGIRFYAGVPLTTDSHLPLGALCVIDTQPRTITPRQIECIRTLAGFVSAQFELSRRTHQLRVQRDLNQMLVENASDYAMFTLAADGVITSCNSGSCRMLGYAMNELIGKNYRQLFTPDDQANQVPERSLATSRADGRTECTGWRARKDASTFHVIGTIDRVTDDNGVCNGFVKVVRDDTKAWLTSQQLERRTAELAAANVELCRQKAQLQIHAREVEINRSAAEAASRSKSEFLANMSHEIRTPMTAILGFTELLATEESTSPQQRRQYISTIRRNGEHLLSIINDILDISRIEAGKMNLDALAVAPAQVISDVLSLMDIKASAKGLLLAAEFCSPIPESITTDPLRLRQILVNLVGNAIKFTERGSVRLRVRYLPATRNLSFEVVDTGIGLSADQLPGLFAPFAQADSSTTRRFGGTGLGLHISRRLANMLGGDIAVSSIPGGGSTFTLTLTLGEQPISLIDPAAARAHHHADRDPAFFSARDPHPAASAPTPLPLAGKHFLLAEDGPDNRQLICFHLRKAGATITTVENGRCAVEALTTDGTLTGPLLQPPPFDIILTDMQMPEMDGYEATNLLRTKGCMLPIVALTAHSMNGDAERCLKAGCDLYAAKPIDRARLIQTCIDAFNQCASRSARHG